MWPILTAASGAGRSRREHPTLGCVSRPREAFDVITFGIILMIIGFVAGIPFLWTVGVILLVIGLVLFVLGSLGHAVGGRRHYY